MTKEVAPGRRYSIIFSTTSSGQIVYWTPDRDTLLCAVVIASFEGGSVGTTIQWADTPMSSPEDLSGILYSSVGQASGINIFLPAGRQLKIGLYFTAPSIQNLTTMVIEPI
jgi:hypothetical protein